MTKYSKHDFWRLYADRYSREFGLTHEWVDHATRDPSLVKQMVAEQRIDTLLRLESQTEIDHQNFVQACLDRLTEESTPERTQTGNAHSTQNQITDLDNEKSESHQRANLRFPSPEFDRKTVQNYSRPEIGSRFRSTAFIAISLSIFVLVVGSIAVRFGMTNPMNSAGRPAKTNSVETVASEKNEGQTSNESSPQTLKPTIPDSVEPRPPVPGLNESPASVPIASTNSNRSIPMDVPTDTPNPTRPKNDPLKTREEVTFAELALIRPNYPSATKPRIGPGVIEFYEGKGILKFDNGVKLFIQSPFKGNIVSSNRIELDRGKILANIPSGAGEFVVTTPNYSWGSNRANFQVHLEPKSDIEAFVSSGRVAVNQTNSTKSPQPIDLSSKDLNQLVIRSSDENTVPTVAIARGKKRFLGQIGFEHENFTTSSPLVFDQINANLAQNRSLISRPEFSKQWRQFVIDTQKSQGVINARVQLPFENAGGKNLNQKNKNSSDDSTNGSSSFHGVLVIDGQEHTFDSLDEFRRAQERMMQRNPLNKHPGNGFNENVPGNLPSLSRGEFNINGHSMKFTSPDLFKRFQREIKR